MHESISVQHARRTEMNIKKMKLPWRAWHGTHIVDAEDNAVAFNVGKEHAKFIVEAVNAFKEAETVVCADCGVAQVAELQPEFGFHGPGCSEIKSADDE